MTTTIKPQHRTDAVKRIAELVLIEQLDGQDIHDITVAIDWQSDPADWTGCAGDRTHSSLLMASILLDESAYDLMQSVTAQLGW